MAQETSAPCSLLEWDSGFFGFPVAQVAGEILSQPKGRAALEWSRVHSIKCLYFLADPNSPETAELAYRLGFKLVDVRLQLSIASRSCERSKPPQFALRTARPSDVFALQAIARGAHQDSRFFFDSDFQKTRAEDLFATWIATDCAGRADRVLTIEGEGGRPIGYVTCNLIKGSNTGRVGLVGVASEVRGRGFGKALVSGALEWFWSADVETVFVVTQARNVAAQRLYQTAGFRTDSVGVWYHRWF